MKKIFYYTTTALVLSCGITQAQTCVPTPDCQTLGYTSSSYCDGGLKCPFGNYWNCDAVNCELSGKITELTEKIAELETKIAGIDSGNKTYDCLIGDIFYSDWTCSTELDTNKTPIAVVVYMDGAGHGQALALKSAGSYTWDTTTLTNMIDIPVLKNFSNASAASQDYESCLNTKKIIDAGGAAIYGAAYATYYYKTTGTEMGDWCLPAAGIFTSYYNNQDAINTGFDKVGGTKFTTTTEAWSSSEYDYYTVWRSYFNNNYGLESSRSSGTYKGTKRYSYEVRPVIEF